jgi:integrase
MRKRDQYQRGRVVKSSCGRYWIGKYYGANGRDQSTSLGKVSKITKTKARELLAEVVKNNNKPVTATSRAQPDITLKEFVNTIYFPFYRHRWKRVSDDPRTRSITRHIVGDLGDRPLRSLKRNELQDLLDRRKHMAKTMVDHLRWDIKQILDFAVAEGILERNPAYPGKKMLLFVPRECALPRRPVMTFDQVKLAIAVLPLRERLVFKLGVLAGMRESEIFGLRRSRVHSDHVEVIERVFRRDIDTPKTDKSVRTVALNSDVQRDMKAWLDFLPGGPDDWLFPSENPSMPISATNLMARNIKPLFRADNVKLGWVGYRVMRRTHSSLMKDKGIDPKLVADQQGHTVDVNQNVYTQTSINARLEAVETLASELVN